MPPQQDFDLVLVRPTVRRDTTAGKTGSNALSSTNWRGLYLTWEIKSRKTLVVSRQNVVSYENDLARQPLLHFSQDEIRCGDVLRSPLSGEVARLRAEQESLQAG